MMPPEGYCENHDPHQAWINPDMSAASKTEFLSRPMDEKCCIACIFARMKSRGSYVINGLVIMALALSVTSCRKGPLFEEFQALPNNNWNRFHAIWFNYTPESIKKPVQIELIIRYSEVFEAERVDFMATIHAPSGEQRFKEYHFTARDREGRITGKAPEGTDQPATWYEGVVVLRKDFILQEPGLYRIEIENLMNKYDNKGITGIGLRILPSPKAKDK